MPNLPTPASGGSLANFLGPGIVGLFIQGIETGMVFSQLATWLVLPGHTEHRFVTVLTVFITTIGLLQTVLCFLSSQRIYVVHYGEPVFDVVVPAWNDNLHILLTVLISSPVQLLLIWRCYHILRRNIYIIIPLLLLLLCTVILAIFDTIGFLRPMSGGAESSRSPVFWCRKRPLFLYIYFRDPLF